MGIVGYFVVLFGTFAYFWVLWCTFGYFSVLLETFGYFWVLLGTYGYLMVLLGTFRYLGTCQEMSGNGLKLLGYSLKLTNKQKRGENTSCLLPA